MTEKSKRILLVDDSEDARTGIVQTLEREMPETEIVLTDSIGDACAWLDRSHFNLITTALMIPNQDGLAVSRYARASSKNHHTPTIVVCGDTGGHLMREGFSAGVTDYFDKSLGHLAFAKFIKNFTQFNAGWVGRVLYVEDNELAASVIIQIMERHGLLVLK